MLSRDNLVNCFLLVFGYRYLSEQVKFLNLEKEEYESSLKREFIFLTWTAISRFVIHTYLFVYQPLITLVELDSERPLCFTKTISLVNLGYVLIAPLIMHFLPVTAALYIYTPQWFLLSHLCKQSSIRAAFRIAMFIVFYCKYQHKLKFIVVAIDFSSFLNIFLTCFYQTKILFQTFFRICLSAFVKVFNHPSRFS